MRVLHQCPNINYANPCPGFWGNYSLREKERFLQNNGVSCFSEVHETIFSCGAITAIDIGVSVSSIAPTTIRLIDFRRLSMRREYLKIDLVPFVVDRNAEQLIDLYCTKPAAWAYGREWWRNSRASKHVLLPLSMGLKSRIPWSQDQRRQSWKRCRSLLGKPDRGMLARQKERE